MGAKLSTVYKSTGENLESLSLIWLDAHVDTSRESIQLQTQLRSVINYLKTFQDASECEKYIRSVNEKQQLVLVVSGRFGRDLVPKIHALRQIASIYIYCTSKEANEQWTTHFLKVKDLSTQSSIQIYSCRSRLLLSVWTNFFLE